MAIQRRRGVMMSINSNLHSRLPGGGGLYNIEIWQGGGKRSGASPEQKREGRRGSGPKE